VPVNVATTASGNTETAKALTIATATAQSKMYDGGTAVTIIGTLQSAEAFGSGSGDGMPYTGDSLTVSCTGSTFASSAAGAGISVTAGTFHAGWPCRRQLHRDATFSVVDGGHSCHRRVERHHDAGHLGHGCQLAEQRHRHQCW